MVRNRKKNNIHHRSLRLEPLESRELLTVSNGSWYELCDFSAYQPTVYEQEMLELINHMRMNPQSEYEKLVLQADPSQPMMIAGQWNEAFFAAYSQVITNACRDRYPAGSPGQLQSFINDWLSLTAVAPLAYNTQLLQVASDYNNYMRTYQSQVTGEFEHNPNLDQLLGHDFSVYGENVYATAIPSAYRYYSGVSFLHAAFAIDWGNSDASHRANIMNAEYSEIGISVLTPNVSNTKYYTTIDFGTSSTGARTDGAYLLGVVYNDANQSKFYDAGEGLNGVTLAIRRTGSSDPPLIINSLHAGGYQVFLENGTYTITAYQGSGYGGTVTKTFKIDGSNIKIDFLTSDYHAGTPLIDLGGGIYYDYGTAVQYNEKSPAKSIIPNVTLTDSSGKLQMAVIRFASAVDIEKESLNLGSSATLISTINYDDGSWTITCLNGQGTLAEFRQLLQTLSYVYTGEDFPLEERVISIQVFDGENWSNEAFATITMVPLAPVLTIENAKVYETDSDSGAQTIQFTAKLSFAPSQDVSFYCSTVNGTALAGNDYIAQVQKITIRAGETSATFTINILGNYDPQRNGAGVNTLYNPNDDLYFTLQISQLEGVAFRNKEIRGTIIDDDTPSRMITTETWSLDTSLTYKTAYGTQRFVYAIVATGNGVMTWTAVSDIPQGFTISIYEDVYSATPLAGAIYRTTATGQSAQWTVSAGKKYIIKLESTGATILSHQKMQLLGITTDNVVLVDPLWDKLPVDQRILNVQFRDGEIFFGVGDNLWSLPNGAYSLQTTNPGTLLFQLDGDAGRFSTVANEIGAPSYQYTSGGNQIIMDGFTNMVIVGNNAMESIEFEGSEGDDILSFAQGGGSFIVNANNPHLTRLYFFLNVTSISFDGGTGGDDHAELYDSFADDAVKATDTSVTLSGGGYEVAVTNFPKVNLYLINGGGDDVFLKSESLDTSLFLTEEGLILSGNLNSQNSSRLVTAPLLFNIRSYNSLTTDSESSLAMVYVITSVKTTTLYEASIGKLQTINTTSGTTNLVNNVRQIVFLAGNTPNSGELNINDQDCEVTTNTQTATVTFSKQVDAISYSISMPVSWYSQIVSSALPTSQMASAVLFTEAAEAAGINGFEGESKDIADLPTRVLFVQGIIQQDTQSELEVVLNIILPQVAFLQNDTVQMPTQKNLSALDMRGNQIALFSQSITPLPCIEETNNKVSRNQVVSDTLLRQKIHRVLFAEGDFDGSLLNQKVLHEHLTS